VKGRTPKIAAVSIALLSVILVSNRVSNRLGIVQGQQKKQKKLPGEGFATVPGLKGGQDVFGPLRSGAELYTPRKGADPAFLVGEPWPGVW
jgi:hypothetical protein